MCVVVVCVYGGGLEHTHMGVQTSERPERRCELKVLQMQIDHPVAGLTHHDAADEDPDYHEVEPDGRQSQSSADA